MGNKKRQKEARKKAEKNKEPQKPEPQEEVVDLVRLFGDHIETLKGADEVYKGEYAQLLKSNPDDMKARGEIIANRVELRRKINLLTQELERRLKEGNESAGTSITLELVEKVIEPVSNVPDTGIVGEDNATKLTEKALEPILNASADDSKLPDGLDQSWLETRSSGSSDKDSDPKSGKESDSFELMRKGQHKASQEKQKLQPEKNKSDFDVSRLLDANSKHEKTLLPTSSEIAEPLSPPASNEDADKSTLPLQTPASRPLQTPASRPLHTPASRPLQTPASRHLQTPASRPLQTPASRPLQTPASRHLQTPASRPLHTPASRPLQTPASRHLQTPASRPLQTPASRPLHTPASRPLQTPASRPLQTPASRPLQTPASRPLIPPGFTSKRNLGTRSLNHPHQVEPHESKADEAVRPHIVNYSKFAKLFNEADKKPAHEIASGRPNDLFSSIVGNSQYLNKSTKPDAVLTCEDLEREILSEMSEGLTLQLPVVPDGKAEQPKSNVNYQASQHLLSVLQKGIEPVSAVMTCEEVERSIFSEMGWPPKPSEVPFPQMIRNDPAESDRFHANILRPPFLPGQSGFDAHHHPMLQQMQMAGNFPPPHLLQGLSSAPALPPHPNRGAPLPAHPVMEEMNPMPGFPFGPQPTNFSGHGMPLPGCQLFEHQGPAGSDFNPEEEEEFRRENQ